MRSSAAVKASEKLRALLLAAIITAGMKLASAKSRLIRKSALSLGDDGFTKKILYQVWTALYELGREGLKDAKTTVRRKKRPRH
jgi:hypothetical protein